MASFVILLHLVGWGTLVALVAPQEYQVAGQFFGIGLGVTAYTLGLRHAFDADHIAAIDNTTRKLMTEGQRPMSVGFWFSLGHSSVVFLMVALLAIGIRALAGAIEDDESTLQQITGVWGTSVVRGLPHRDRADQPGRSGRHHPGLPQNAVGSLRRG
jgi:high-affinity nickel-transport protein